ncbi:MAG: D-glycerate dehydrogenase [Planctomycetota bacterium]|nr:D-glycerate dehydrogenase [Planctomycetota bacterium]
MKPRALVTRHVYPAAIPILQEQCVVDYQDTYEVMDEERLARKLALADGVVCQLTDPMTRAVIEAAPNLKVISQVAVGHDNIDVRAATERGIVVTNTPGVLTEATADLTFALLLAAARRLPEAERYLRDGRWERWDVDLLCGGDVHGRTLGVVGLGRIGQAVARRAMGFGMRVLYTGRRDAPPAVERELNARRVPLNTLLSESDFVTLHVPLSEETHHMISVAQLCAMKPHAVLINTARGPVVDECALVAALEEGLLGGAALDVFEHEPAVPDALLALDNVVLLPHVGSAVTSVRSLMCALAARDCAAVLSGREGPQHVVNPEVLR